VVIFSWQARARHGTEGDVQGLRKEALGGCDHASVARGFERYGNGFDI
jgi:hypothetical protein